jgi:hypothetical protein
LAAATRKPTPDQKSAEAQAVKLFDLTEEQRKRPSIWEWRWS